MLQSTQASGGTGEKKRKRAAADAFSETQLAKLQVRVPQSRRRMYVWLPWECLPTCYLWKKHFFLPSPCRLSHIDSAEAASRATPIQAALPLPATLPQAAFAENEYPNTAAKAALAEELGVEAAQVGCWGLAGSVCTPIGWYTGQGLGPPGRQVGRSTASWLSAPQSHQPCAVR